MVEDSIKRSRKLTDKGQHYMEDLLERMFTKSIDRLENQFKVVSSLLDTTHDTETLNNESSTLDKLFHDILDIVARKRDLMETGDERRDELDEVVDTLDGRFFEIKRRISGKIQTESASLKLKTKHSKGSVTSRASLPSEGSSNSRASRSSRKQKALIAGLQAEREAMLKLQEAEVQAEILKAEEEKKLAI